MKLLSLIITLISLSACGFHPVYGVNKHTPIGAETQFQNIEISNIPDREGQFLRNDLLDRFYRDGKPQNARYRLEISRVTESIRELDITIDSDTTRAQLTLLTEVTLIDKRTNEALLERSLRSTASFNVLGSEFANRVSEQNTRENVLKDLARQIERQIALYFKRPEDKKRAEAEQPLRFPSQRLPNASR